MNYESTKNTKIMLDSIILPDDYDYVDVCANWATRKVNTNLMIT